nr:hypothetical protein [Tanacetum cinerariifolium]
MNTKPTDADLNRWGKDSSNETPNSQRAKKMGESVPLENMMDATDCDDKRGENEMANYFDEEESVNLPSSKVPRLHCLVHRKLLVNDLISSSPTMEPKPDLLRGIRESLLRHLTVVLGDDELAAHFMLLHLLSKVHLRVDSVAVGKLSLNLIGFDKSIVLGDDELAAHFMLLHLLSKDYKTNRFVSGALQCAEGSHLTVDETPLQSGTLNNN